MFASSSIWQTILVFSLAVQLYIMSVRHIALTFQKQPSGDVLKKRCSENMLQIYRRKPMPKCEIALQHGCPPANLLYIFWTPFPRNTSGWLRLTFAHITFKLSICNWNQSFYKNKFFQFLRIISLIRFIIIFCLNLFSKMSLSCTFRKYLFFQIREKSVKFEKNNPL